MWDSRSRARTVSCHWWRRSGSAHILRSSPPPPRTRQGAPWPSSCTVSSPRHFDSDALWHHFSTTSIASGVHTWCSPLLQVNSTVPQPSIATTEPSPKHTIPTTPVSRLEKAARDPVIWWPRCQDPNWILVCWMIKFWMFLITQIEFFLSSSKTWTRI
jgi:hypothetical protein